MGYDSDECIECYCEAHVNNFTNVVPRSICSECFLSHCPGGLVGRAAMQSYVPIKEDGTCDCCGKEGVPCLDDVAVCTGCLKAYWPPEAQMSEDESDHPYEECSDSGEGYAEGYWDSGSYPYHRKRQWLWDLFIVPDSE